MSLKTIAQNLSNHLGKDTVIRLIVSTAIFLDGSFSLVLENNSTENASNYAYLLSKIFTIETMAHMARSSRIIAKKFGTARLCLRFVEDIPAFFALKQFIQSNFMSSKVKTKKPKSKKLEYYKKWAQ